MDETIELALPGGNLYAEGSSIPRSLPAGRLELPAGATVMFERYGEGDLRLTLECESAGKAGAVADYFVMGGEDPVDHLSCPYPIIVPAAAIAASPSLVFDLRGRFQIPPEISSGTMQPIPLLREGSVIIVKDTFYGRAFVESRSLTHSDSIVTNRGHVADLKLLVTNEPGLSVSGVLQTNVTIQSHQRTAPGDPLSVSMVESVVKDPLFNLITILLGLFLGVIATLGEGEKA